MDVVLQELRIPTLRGQAMRLPPCIARRSFAPCWKVAPPPSARSAMTDTESSSSASSLFDLMEEADQEAEASEPTHEQRKAATVNASRLAASFAPLINDLLQVQVSFLVGDTDTNLGEADAQQLRDYLAEGREVLAQAEEEIANFSPNLCWGKGLEGRRGVIVAEDMHEKVRLSEKIRAWLTNVQRERSRRMRYEQLQAKGRAYKRARVDL